MIKYLHVLCQKSPNFNSQVIEMINSKLNLQTNSTFISNDEDLINKFNDKNIIFNTNFVDLINMNYENYDYIFIHALNFSIKDLIKLKKKAIKKFIWCVWGHDLYLSQNSLKDKMKYKLKKYILKDMYAVGLGFYMDILEVKKFLGYNCKDFFLPYGYESNSYDSYLKLYNNQIDNKTKRILVSHSGFRKFNHINVLTKLKKFKNEDIKIVLVLAYGEKDYIKEVKQYAYDNFSSEKIIIIEDFMNSLEYMQLLNTIDIAIFDFTMQAALGNIWKLAFLGKKIYLNEDSIIKKGFDMLGLQVESTLSIENMSFKEFSKSLSEVEIQKLHNYGDLYVNENNILNAWKNFFKTLESKKNRL